MSIKQNIKKVGQLLNTTGTDILGFAATTSLRNVVVKHPELEQLFKDKGLEKYVPKAPTVEMALKRAIIEWARDKARAGDLPSLSGSGFGDWNGVGDTPDQAGQTTKMRCILRTVKSAQADWLVWSLVFEKVDLADLGLEYDTHVRIALNKKSKALFITKSTSGAFGQDIQHATDLEQELTPYWLKFKDAHISSDLTPALKNLILESAAGIPMRPEGGSYFVPANRRDELQVIKELVESLPIARGEGSFLVALPVTGANEAQDSTTKHDMARVAERGIMSEVYDLRTDLKWIIGENQKKQRRVSPATVAKHLAHFNEVRTKAEGYKILLGMEVDNITQIVGELEQAAQSLLLGNSAPAPAPVPVPASPAAAPQTAQEPSDSSQAVEAVGNGLNAPQAAPGAAAAKAAQDQARAEAEAADAARLAAIQARIQARKARAPSKEARKLAALVEDLSS